VKLAEGVSLAAFDKPKGDAKPQKRGKGK